MAETVAALGIVADSSGLVKSVTDMRELAREALNTKNTVSMFTVSMTEVSRNSKTAAAGINETANASNRARGVMESTRRIIDGTSTSTLKYTRALANLKRNLDAQNISMNEYVRMVRQVRTAMNEAGAASSGMTGMTNRTTFAITNASYQVQDFAVQIASGTDAMRAFAQQAPQFLGALGFSGKLALWGSIAGTVVAVGAALWPVLSKTADEAKKGKTAFEEASEALQNYSRYMEQAREYSSGLTGELGKHAAALAKMAQVQAEFEKAESLSNARKGIEGGLEKIAGDSVRYKPTYDDGYLARRLDAQTTIENMARDLDTHIVGVMDVLKQIQAINSATTLEGFATEASKLNEVFTDLYGSMSEAPEAVQELWKETSKIALEYADEIIAGNKAKAQELYSFYAEMAEKGKEGTNIGSNEENNHLQERIDKMYEYLDAKEREISMAEAIRTYGEDSVQVEALKKEEALAAAEAFITQNEYSGQAADLIRDAAAAAADSASETDRWADAMAGVKAELSAVQGILSAIANVGIKAAANRAIQEALRAGANSKDAALAGERTTINETAKVSQSDPSIGLTERYLIEQKRQAELELLDLTTETATMMSETQRAEREAAKAARGGGGRKKRKPAKSEAQKEAEKERKEMARDAERWMDRIQTDTEKLAEEQQELNKLYQEGYFGDKGSVEALSTYHRAMKLVQEEYDPLTKATKEWTETLKTGILDSITGAESLTDTFYSLGKAIEKALWQATLFGEGPFAKLFGGGSGILGGVMDWLEGIGGAEANAKGGVYTSANLSTYSGQIVSKPTLFAFANGAGLMGEAGPEAIMPLSRGPDGRLGIDAPRGASSSGVHIYVHAEEGEMFRPIVEAIAEDKSIEVTQTAMAQADEQFPTRVFEALNNDRAR